MSLAPSARRWWSSWKSAGAVDIIRVDAAPHGGWEAAAVAWLDRGERARWQNYAYEGPRRRFALCRAALRAVLCEQLHCDNAQLSIAAGCHGKPFALIAGEPAAVSFNVSHSGRHGLLAVAPAGRVGVDVEERDVRRNLDLLIDTVLCEEEQAALAATRGRTRIDLFFKLWTIKEAVLKAVGKGFRLDATRIETPPPMLRGRRKSALQLPQFSGAAWQIEDLGNREFAAAVAYEAAETPARRD